MAKRVRSLPPDIVTAAAERITDATNRQCRADLGGDGRLSGMPGTGRFDITARTQGSDAASLRPTEPGIAAILEYGTRPHPVAAKKGRKSKALKIAGQWVTGPVLVRGSPAKHSWSRGVEAGTPAAIEAAGEQLRTVTNGS